MSRKPFEVYTANAWAFLAQPKVEGQWFERKAPPSSQPPRGLRDFVYDRIARTICGFANSNPDVGGLLVIGIGDQGELHGIDRHGTDYVNTLLSYADPMRTSSMVQRLSISSSTLCVITALLII